MRIEQQASLNKHVDPTIPLTWLKRWQIIKPILPLVVVLVALMVEMVALSLWMDGRSLPANWPRLVIAPLGVIALLVGDIELQLRLRHRAKRWLKLDPQKITTQQGWLPWKRLASWRLEPLLGEPKFRKLTLEHTWSKKASRIRSMVLLHPDQTQLLKSEVEHLRQRGLTIVPLVEMAEPSPALKQRQVRRTVVMALAYYLFIHGWPLLLVGVFGGNKSTESEHNAHTHSVGAEKLGRILVTHFSSAKKLRAGFILAGSMITGAGIVCYAWGIRTAGKKQKGTLEEEAGACPSRAVPPGTD